MSEKLLHIKNLCAGYEKDKPILNDFNLELSEGESVGIIGQNGSGKSTLAKAIMGITPYSKGNIIWQGKQLLNTPINEKKNLGIGYLMQGGKIFENLSVEDNLKFAILNQKNINFDEVIKKLQEKDITLLKQKKRLQIKASYLSGGEKHILAFLMVILANPEMKLLIADEPSAGIAKGIQQELLQIIKQTISDKKISLILIEHNKFFLSELTSRIVRI